MTSSGEKKEISVNDGGETNVSPLTCVLDGFSESAEIRALICSLPEVHGDPLSREILIEKLILIMDRYQLQPHLLDPHKEWMFNSILDFVRNESSSPSLFHLCFKCLYIICKVRGYKNFMQLFPHEVADLKPVLDMLSQQDLQDRETWRTRYMLLLWLSKVCLIPFDLSYLDGFRESDEEKPKETIMKRILDIAKSYLSADDASRGAASVLVSKFMTRLDVTQKHLGDFLDWSLTTISQTSDDTLANIRVLDGVLQALAKLFKHGKRDDLIQYAPAVLKCLEENKLSGNSGLLRKLFMKLFQRLGLTFLKPRLASWRYQRGNRSLNLSLSQSDAKVITEAAPEEQEEDYDIPEEVESVIEHLLVGLKDKDTIVRWSAAKGIGRMTGRFPVELANEVVGSVLECFSFQNTENAWHGGCLALAELGRRGLLLPSRLTEVVPLIMTSLTYEEKRGACSVGSDVRDAACYVCWSFARAYEPKELQPFVTQIARSLLITAVFDRNIKCRQAASAAFQENVGRQGTFPHGIPIVTATDYFAMGNLRNCYLNISVYVAGFPEYTEAMIDHLVDMKINHWEGVLRELATKALHNLTPLAPDYMRTTVLPKLLNMAVGMDVQGRHGAILACGEVTYALYKVGRESERAVIDLISPECVEALKSIHQKMQERKQYRGFGGELMRPAICGLIEKLSLSKMPFKNDPVIPGWQWIIDDTINTLHLVSSSAKDGIMLAVVSALLALCEEYYQSPTGQADPETQEVLVSRYIEGLQSTQMLARCGSALALGCLPAFMIHKKLEQILKGLQQMCVITQKEGTFTEARKDAVRSIAQVCLKAGVCANGTPDSSLCSENISEVYDLLINSMNDYTRDGRGDIGAWVREAAMSSLRDLTLLISSSAPEILTPDLVKSLMVGLAQQAAETNDRYRAHAGNIFLHLLHSAQPAVPHIPQREELLFIFPAETTTSLDWRAPSQAFQYIAQLLRLPEYQYHTLLGLTMSVGGITESTVHFSSQSLFDFMKEIQFDNAALDQFGETLLKVFRDNLLNYRILIPFLKMLNQMLITNCFEVFITQKDHPFCVEILTLCTQCTNSRDIPKIRGCIAVFCGMIQFQGDVRKKVLSQLLRLLCHSYPWVRKNAADQMYEMLLTYDDIINPEVMDDVMTLLSDTNWQNEVKIVRTPRNQLCDWLEVPRPQRISSAPSPES